MLVPVIMSIATLFSTDTTGQSFKQQLTHEFSTVKEHLPWLIKILKRAKKY